MESRTALDAILRANAARARGDATVDADLPEGAHPFVITCMDPRLVGVLIPAMGLDHAPPPQAKFAGAEIQAGDRAASRSVLAAAIFNVATEVFLVGHTDCRMGKTTAGEILAGLARLGVRPDVFEGQDAAGWLGVFASEAQSVRSSVEALRADPRVPPGIPVHGLVFHLDTKKLDVVVRGYEGARGAAYGVVSASGYVPGPSSLGAPPPALGNASPAGPPTIHASGPVTYRAAPPMAPGPVSFGATGGFAEGPVSFGAAPPPLAPSAPPAFPAPPPAPVPVRPPAAVPHASTFPETRPMDEPLPPPPPPPSHPAPPAPEKHHKKKRSKGDSPFDRAHEVLDRMRRNRGDEI